MSNLNLIDTVKPIMGASPAALIGVAGDGDYVTLKNYARMTVVIVVDNATTVTGGDVTLKQATDVSGTSEKALSFDTVYANTDTTASDTLVETAVVSDTFTTDATDNKNLLYVIEVKSEDLDVNGGFTSVRVDVDNMANAVGSVIYLMHGARFAPGLDLSSIVD